MPDILSGVSPLIYNSTPPTATDGQGVSPQSDINGNQKVTLATLIAGEDLTNNLQVVENRYSYSKVTADTLIKTGSGFLHTITLSCNDSAPTAGTIILYDNTVESGTQIFNTTITTTFFYPITLIFNTSFTTGLFVGFTTTNDVNVTVSYR